MAFDSELLTDREKEILAWAGRCSHENSFFCRIRGEDVNAAVMELLTTICGSRFRPEITMSPAQAEEFKATWQSAQGMGDGQGI